ncbi:hypothetical protein GCM10010885_16150 [Alicyclobacillus cellulosilyticus]|uniref:Methyltransferase domain-containing protein n=1 Tax=Alicyclobacillus cellulosilyticus TaxID=1003997 RepID=A0A917KC68_9BACL|nr:class I SAM-dependent methyltransferase [Alicyclobacillus cellulosilyticus]GGJ07792.1 hypothetical protein GCM10010885_16150 [Alicyclobacillus cellulosilyticus]
MGKARGWAISIKQLVDFFDMVGQTDWNRLIQRTLIHWIGIHDRQRILEAGCGVGRFTLLLAQRAHHVDGVDVHPLMIERARRIARDFGIRNVTYTAADMAALPFADASFDVVTSMNLLFANVSPVQVLRELARVAKPGAQIVLLCPTREMNPWSAHIYCEKRQLHDFERDSLISWATAASRQQTHHGDMDRIVRAAGLTVAERAVVLDGLAQIMKVDPPGESKDGAAKA